MEMSPERERDGLGAVPRSHDDRPLGRHSVYRALQSSPGPAGLDRNVSPPSARDFHDTITQPSRRKRAVSARGERQPTTLLERVDHENRSRAGKLQEEGYEQTDDTLAEDQGRLTEPHWRVVDNVQGRLEVGAEYAEHGV